MNKNTSENMPRTETEECCACSRYKQTPRGEQTVKQLQNRLSRIIGQLNGIKTMLDDNRYCGDVLTQVAAVESALQSFGYIILQNHLETCVVEEIKKDNTQILDEALDLIKKLK
jgi:CsoR family transcriptional regulator, copper-sensing transcriptional repressor